MRLPAGAPLGVASLFALTCSSSTEPAVVVSAIMPTQAFNDAKVDVVISGGPFRPAYDIDTVGGSAVTQLGAFSAVLTPSTGTGPSFAVGRLTWLSATELAAEVPEGIVPGTYDVLVRDPRGAPGTLPRAFASLGPDRQAPVVSGLEPDDGAVVDVGAEVPGVFVADDGAGELGSMTWTVTDTVRTVASGACPVDPGVAKATCRFVFTAPTVTQAEIVTVHVEARDVVGNVSGAESKVVIALPPVVAGVTPREGPSGGGTELEVTGDAFVVGTEVLVDGAPLPLAVTTLVSAQSLKALMPAHEPGVVALSIRSGAATASAGTFEFVGLPVVLVVSPATGPLAGNIPVIVAGRNFRDLHGNDGTKITLGPHDGPRVALACQQFVNSNRITGVLPPGAGAVSVFASDAVGGDSELKLAFTYIADEQADAGVAPPGCLKMMGMPP